MKKSLATIFIISLSMHIYGQLNWVYSENDGGCQSFLKTTWGDFALTHGANSAFMSITPDGNLNFDMVEIPLPEFNSFQGYVDIFEMAENTYGVISDFVAFDTASGWGFGYRAVNQYDQTGLVIPFTNFSLYSMKSGLRVS